MKQTLLLLLFLIAAHSVQGQADWDITNTGELKNTTVPSPSVSGIAQVTDVPVSLYTGTPDITIPLYTINTGKITWPITLRYNGTGIHVNENSGNVGLGWTISAEGAIIESVQGIKDNGTYASAGISWSNQALLPNTTANFNLLHNLSIGAQDGVPDFYLYNFNGNSGKFFFANGIKLLPQKNLDITSYLEGGQKCWKIIGEDGMQYYFTAMETTLNRAPGSVGNSNDWLLTKVVDPNNTDSILFEYENSCVLMGFGNSYEINNWKDTSGAQNWSVDMEPNDAPIPGTLTQYSQVTNGKQLKRILFKNGSVEYDIAWNEREDMATTGSAAINVPRVKNIFVKDPEGVTIRTIHFTHDYFVTPGVSGVNGKRLRLGSIIFAPTTNNIYAPVAQKYSFSYNDRNLPSKESNAIDHWGYYNGAAANAGLIPTIHYQGMDYYGADRNTSPYHVTAGMLEKIEYPTGGHISFMWENHKIYTEGSPVLVKVDSVLPARVDCEGVANQFQTEESGWVTIPDNDTFNYVQAVLKGSAGHPGGASSVAVNHADAKVILYEVTGNTQITKRTLSFPFSPTNSYQKSVPVKLERGKTYHFIVTSRGGLGYSISGALVIPWPKVKVMGSGVTNIGGCRIKEIRRHDPVSNKDIVKKYVYPDASVFRWPVYRREIYRYINPGYTDGDGEEILCDDVKETGLLLSSNSINDIGSGSHVGYSQVQEFSGNKEGSTLYTYSTFVNQPGEIALNWRYGLLKSVQVFDRNWSMLRQTVYHNKIYTLPGERYTGYRASCSGNHPCAEPSNVGLYPAYYFTSYYDLPVDWVYTDTVEEYDYISGVNFLRVNNYDNPQHQQLTRSTVLYPDGSRQTTFLKYPTDFTFSGTPSTSEAAAVKLLQDKHIHNMPLEQYAQKWLPESVTALTLAGSYNEFKTSGTLNTKVLPYNTYALGLANGINDYAPAVSSGTAIQKDNRYIIKASAAEYDNAASLVTLTGPGGSSAGNIWGHKSSLLIAKAKNHMAGKKIAFTSFEKDAAGNWTYNTVSGTATDHITGKRCYNLNAGTVQHNVTSGSPAGPSDTISGRYVVSYWKKNGIVSVNNTSPGLTGTTVNGWTYCEHVLLDPQTVSVTGTALIDELRLYPVGAAMESYTYDPLIGVTSYDNAASHIVFYEYDAMGRLSVERDIYGNILQQHSYGYQVAE